MQEWEASLEEKASQEAVVSCSLEGEEREVSVANGKDKAFNYQSDDLIKTHKWYFVRNSSSNNLRLCFV